jgi:hypothetical protein
MQARRTRRKGGISPSTAKRILSRCDKNREPRKTTSSGKARRCRSRQRKAQFFEGATCARIPAAAPGVLDRVTSLPGDDARV